MKKDVDTFTLKEESSCIEQEPASAAWNKTSFAVDASNLNRIAEGIIFIKNLPKGSKYGISDDYPKEIDEIRKKLYPVLKAAKKEKKSAYFNVYKLIIDYQIYRGPETSNLPLYGRIMSS